MGLVGETMSGTGDSSLFSRLGLSGTKLFLKNVILKDLVICVHKIFINILSHQIFIYTDLEVVLRTVKSGTAGYFVYFFGVWMMTMSCWLSSKYCSDSAH